MTHRLAGPDSNLSERDTCGVACLKTVEKAIQDCCRKAIEALAESFQKKTIIDQAVLCIVREHLVP